MLQGKEAQSYRFSKSEKYLKRLGFYLGITILCIVFSGILSSEILSPKGFVHSNPDSALYMVSTLIQSEAAILAIIITLSLVAVQQTASTYSSRVTEIFKDKNRNPDFWILITIYMGSMIYGAFILKQIGNDELYFANIFQSYLPENFVYTLFDIQTAIWFTFFLSGITFVALGMYTRSTLELLNPSKIIEILSEDITERQLQLAADKMQTKDYDDKDPIHPIIDIVSSSLINYDHQTAKKGLTTVEKSTQLLSTGNFDDERFQKISLSMIRHLTNIGKLAVKKDDEGFALEVLENIKWIGRKSISRKDGYISTVAVESITQIGKISIEQKVPYVAIRSLDLLDYIWETINRENTRRPSISIIESQKIKIVIPKIAISIEEIKKGASDSNVRIVVNEAENLSEKVCNSLTLYPNNVKMWNNWIWILKSYELFKGNKFNLYREDLNLDIHEEALRNIGKVPEIYKTADVFILEGDILQEQGKNDEALLTYSKAINADPNSVAAWIFKGNLHFKLREFSNALNAYERALKMSQDEPFIWYSKGSIFFELYQYDEALDACDRAIKIDPTYSDALRLKRVVLKEKDTQKRELFNEKLKENS